MDVYARLKVLENRILELEKRSIVGQESSNTQTTKDEENTNDDMELPLRIPYPTGVGRGKGLSKPSHNRSVPLVRVAIAKHEI